MLDHIGIEVGDYARSPYDGSAAVELEAAATPARR
jgi:hypothetical protein